jgi:uncharacterized protein YbbC (DUF1343 family)
LGKHGGVVPSFKLGVDVLLDEKVDQLKGRRLAVVAHPASLNKDLKHTLDLLSEVENIDLCAAFGPQHGMRGEKQDNMVETDDYRDPKLGIPVYSLYGDVRRPKAEMMASFDVLLFFNDTATTEIYTFLTTLRRGGKVLLARAHCQFAMA